MVKGVVHYQAVFRLQEDVARRAELLRRLERRLAAVMESATEAAPSDKVRYQHQVKFWKIDVERGRKRLAAARQHLEAAIAQRSAVAARVRGAK